MQALVVIDMLNDFLIGKIANPRAEHIIPPIAALLRPGSGQPLELARGVRQRCTPAE
ncbi:MAG: hypothetical protein ACLQBX_11180 [Candidatus Limnocylindrales bacterium]|jgi:hypothetical protein